MIGWIYITQYVKKNCDSCGNPFFFDKPTSWVCTTCWVETKKNIDEIEEHNRREIDKRTHLEKIDIISESYHGE